MESPLLVQTRAIARAKRHVPVKTKVRECPLLNGGSLFAAFLERGVSDL